MAVGPNCQRDAIQRPYLEYEGTGGGGTPLPISSLPQAKFPLTGTEILVMVQAGLTVQVPLDAIMGAADVSLVTVTNGALKLPQASAYLRVINSSGVALSIVPNPAPLEGAVFSVKDWGQNAGSFDWTFIGTVDGNVNPVINTVNGGLCTLIYSANGGWGMSP